MAQILIPGGETEGFATGHRPPRQRRAIKPVQPQAAPFNSGYRLGSGVMIMQVVLPVA